MKKKIFTSSNWITSYNQYTIGETFDPIPVNLLNDKVNNICYEYIQSLVWTTHYYFRECISQEWFYPHEFAPTLHDLHLYLQKEKRVHIKENNITYSPLEQLRFVFPYQSYHLSDELEEVDEINFITKIDKEFTLLKRYDWECHPIFPE